MSEFDIKAADWDKNPIHWKISEAVANEIKRLVPLRKEMIALEYGAGTGITSLMLNDYVKEITLMDNSAEMVKLTNEKIDLAKVKNLKALNFNLEHSDYKEGKFDLIFTQLVLHHVFNIETIISRFSQLLNPGGFIAIADLYEENGSFHGEGFIGHRGFNIDYLAAILRKNSFLNIAHKKCFTIDRKTAENETKQFDVFLLTANLPEI